MTTPFYGEIRMFAGTFAPVGWALCNGQILNVRDNEALFSVLGSTYGGDGRNTFGLPDLKGRVPIGRGSGTGLTPRTIGTSGGAETVTVSTNQLPSHNHGGLQASSQTATDLQPAGRINAQSTVDVYSADSPVDMSSQAVTANTGGSNSHPNVQPFAVINYIIATTGLIPTQT